MPLPVRSQPNLQQSQLSKLGPVPIVAEALGYSPETIEAHRVDSGSTYAQYVGAVRRQRL